jgi:hypothetical protein
VLHDRHQAVGLGAEELEHDPDGPQVALLAGPWLHDRQLRDVDTVGHRGLLRYFSIQ